MLVGMLVGGWLMAMGVVIGRLLPNRNKSPKPPKPICGCTHGLHDHDPVTGACKGKRTVITKRDNFGDPKVWHEDDCTCTRYVGPEPLSTIYAPEITG